MGTAKFQVGVLTLSDKGSKGERTDTSGPIIQGLLDERYEVAIYEIVPDEKALIEAKLRDWSDQRRLSLILTTGGTGVAPRDVTPDATLAVIDKQVPGMAEAMRYASLQKTPMAVISRAVAGIRGTTLIINLPGSPKGAKECLEAVLPALPHALEKIAGDPEDCATN